AASELVVAVGGCASVRSLLPLGCHRWEPAIGGIHDQGGPLRPNHLCAPVVPELVIGNDTARRIIRTALRGIDEIPVLASIFVAFERGGLLVGKHLLVCEFARSFQGSDGVKLPYALKIEWTLRCPGRSLGVRSRRLLRCRRLGNDQLRSWYNDARRDSECKESFTFHRRLPVHRHRHHANSRFTVGRE